MKLTGEEARAEKRTSRPPPLGPRRSGLTTLYQSGAAEPFLVCTVSAHSAPPASTATSVLAGRAPVSSCCSPLPSCHPFCLPLSLDRCIWQGRGWLGALSRSWWLNAPNLSYSTLPAHSAKHLAKHCHHWRTSEARLACVWRRVSGSCAATPPSCALRGRRLLQSPAACAHRRPRCRSPRPPSRLALWTRSCSARTSRWPPSRSPTTSATST